jgi:hypothetical protein
MHERRKMFLRIHDADPRRQIAAGQLCLVAGLLGSRFGDRLLTGSLLAGRLEAWGGAAFWSGFVDGFSGVLLGLSVVLCLTGLWRLRRRPAGRSGG